MELFIYDRFTKEEVEAAQARWAAAVIGQDLETLLSLYDFNREGGPLLFKPTLSCDIRTDVDGTRSYFVGGDGRYPYDQGFIKKGWKSVRFESAAGPVFEAGGRAAVDMGTYYFTTETGDVVPADYTFSYHKPNGQLLITVHHSSLVWEPS